MEVTPEQVKSAILDIIEKQLPIFTTVLDITNFIVRVKRKLSAILEDPSLTSEQRYNNSVTVASTIVDELEIQGIISLELAIEMRSFLKQSLKHKQVAVDLLEIKKSIGNILSSFMT
jgi:hypothetical protein